MIQDKSSAKRAEGTASGTRITDHFDLITGTSTGGIIALGLGMGMAAGDILRFYIDKAKTIFPKKMLADLKHWYDVKYLPEGLEVALKEVFGDRLLGESICRLIIPAFYAKRGEIYLFKTPHHKRLLNDWREKVADVARATAAAPTYLAPFIKESGMQLVDGGVWANNPVMVGISEGLGYCSRAQNSIAALRIGTTYQVPTRDTRTEGGMAVMAKSVIDYMMRGQERSASAMAWHILGKERYYEVNPVAAPGSKSKGSVNKS